MDTSRTPGDVPSRAAESRPLMRSIVEDGTQVFRIARARHGSGRREIGGGQDVPIMVALSACYHVERQTQAGVSRGPALVGAVTVIDPAERTIFTVDGEARVLQLSVSLRLIEEAADARVRAIRPLFNEHDARIERSAMGALNALRMDDRQSDLLLHSVACRLAGILGQPAGGTPASRRGGVTNTAFKRIDDLVRARLDEPMLSPPSLVELAQAAGVSKHHFIKAFRETMGETPYAWVMRQRIERARTLLTQPNETVSDVAFRTGFSSTAHFVASFRQRLGVTPGTFRTVVLT